MSEGFHSSEQQHVDTGDNSIVFRPSQQMLTAQKRHIYPYSQQQMNGSYLHSNSGNYQLVDGSPATLNQGTHCQTLTTQPYSSPSSNSYAVMNQQVVTDQLATTLANNSTFIMATQEGQDYQKQDAQYASYHPSPQQSVGSMAYPSINFSEGNLTNNSGNSHNTSSGEENGRNSATTNYSVTPFSYSRQSISLEHKGLDPNPHAGHSNINENFLAAGIVTSTIPPTMSLTSSGNGVDSISTTIPEQIETSVAFNNFDNQVYSPFNSADPDNRHSRVSHVSAHNSGGGNSNLQDNFDVRSNSTPPNIFQHLPQSNQINSSPSIYTNYDDGNVVNVMQSRTTSSHGLTDSPYQHSQQPNYRSETPQSQFQNQYPPQYYQQSPDGTSVFVRSRTSSETINPAAVRPFMGHSRPTSQGYQQESLNFVAQNGYVNTDPQQQSLVNSNMSFPNMSINYLQQRFTNVKEEDSNTLNMYDNPSSNQQQFFRDNQDPCGHFHLGRLSFDDERYSACANKDHDGNPVYEWTEVRKKLINHYIPLKTNIIPATKSQKLNDKSSDPGLILPFFQSNFDLQITARLYGKKAGQDGSVSFQDKNGQIYPFWTTDSIVENEDDTCNPFSAVVPVILDPSSGSLAFLESPVVDTNLADRKPDRRTWRYWWVITASKCVCKQCGMAIDMPVIRSTPVRMGCYKPRAKRNSKRSRLLALRQGSASSASGNSKAGSPSTNSVLLNKAGQINSSNAGSAPAVALAFTPSSSVLYPYGTNGISVMNQQLQPK